MLIFLKNSIEKGISNGISIMIGEYRFLLSWIIIIGLFLGMFYLILYNTCKKISKTNRIWNEEKEISINEAGIQVLSESASMNLLWGDIIKIVDTKDFIALYYTKSVSILLPKRFIDDKKDKVEEIINKFYIKR